MHLKHIYLFHVSIILCYDVQKHHGLYEISCSEKLHIKTEVSKMSFTITPGLSKGKKDAFGCSSSLASKGGLSFFATSTAVSTKKGFPLQQRKSETPFNQLIFSTRNTFVTNGSKLGQITNIS